LRLKFNCLTGGFLYQWKTRLQVRFQDLDFIWNGKFGDTSFEKRANIIC
jgi:hypothetical protein